MHACCPGPFRRAEHASNIVSPRFRSLPALDLPRWHRGLPIRTVPVSSAFIFVLSVALYGLGLSSPGFLFVRRARNADGPVATPTFVSYSSPRADSARVREAPRPARGKNWLRRAVFERYPDSAVPWMTRTPRERGASGGMRVEWGWILCDSDSTRKEILCLVPGTMERREVSITLKITSNSWEFKGS